MTKKIKFYILITIQIFLLLSMLIPRAFTIKTGRKILLEVVPIDPRSLFKGEYARLYYKISSIGTEEQLKKGQKVYITLKKKERFWDISSVDLKKSASLDKNEDEVLLVGRVKWPGRYLQSEIEFDDFRALTPSNWIKQHPEQISQVKKVGIARQSWAVGDKIYIYFYRYSPQAQWVRSYYKDSTKIFDRLSKTSTNREDVIITVRVVSKQDLYVSRIIYGIEKLFVPEGKAIKIERSPKISAEVYVDKFGHAVINNVFINEIPAKDFIKDRKFLPYIIESTKTKNRFDFSLEKCRRRRRLCFKK